MDESTQKAARLWTSAQPAVAAFVSSVVLDRRDREDIVQETALAVFKAIESYDSQRPFNAWAIGIARNQIGTYLRKHKRDRHVFSEATIANLQAPFAAEVDRPELDFVDVCLRQLQDHARKLCDLRYRQGLKPAAISQQVDMTANAVAKALQRVRAQIKSCIETKVAASASASSDGGSRQ